MKRRLNSAYDRMTMPDACSSRIETALQRELEKKEQTTGPCPGTYTRMQAPGQKRGNVWAAAAAAVLMVMIFSVGGVGLILHLPRQQAPARQAAEPASIPPVTEMIIPAGNPTPEDYYAAATSLPAAQVEAAAKEVRQAVLDRDWYSLYWYLYGDYQGGDLPLRYADEFENFMLLHGIQPDFLEAIEAESCRKMFCNGDDGIMLGEEGQIWLQEIDGKLKIVAINDMLADWLRYEYSVREDGTVQILRYVGGDEHVVIPGTIEGNPVTRIGNFETVGSGAFQDWKFIKTVTIPDTVTCIDDNAFRNCTDLERIDVGPAVAAVGSGAFAKCPSLTAVCFYGDMPEAGSDLFDQSENVTVYYNEPTNGWTDTWQGRPTASRIGLKAEEMAA